MNNSVIEDKNAVDGNGINEQAGPINAALLYDPTEPVYNSSGNFSESAFLTINNPVSIIEGVSSKSRTNRSMGNAYIEYRLTDELSAKVNFGADLQQVRRDIYNMIIRIMSVDLLNII
ncbi:MAG: hypothetical protein LUD02_10665 [Tannerellaceae bacterium]|nr:hypothetical protein [Tannerellaceae bacterium]